MTTAFTDWLMPLRQTLKQRRHRQLIVLSGGLTWRKACLNSLLAGVEHALFIGASPFAKSELEVHSASIEILAAAQLKHRLGQETDLAVFSHEAGFDADSLGILGGMIRGGGLCILSVPDKTRFLNQPNPATQRFLNAPLQPQDSLSTWHQYLWQQCETHALLVCEDAPLPTSNPTRPFAEPSEASAEPHAKQTGATAEQQTVIHALQRLAHGHRKRPLLVLADRGRGKSFALGLGVAELFLSGKHHITLCAARFDQAAQVFAGLLSQTALLAENGLFLTQKVPGLVSAEAFKTASTESFQMPKTARKLVFKTETASYTLQFQAPDALVALKSNIETDLLLIDEAAHLPLPLLQTLLASYPRMALATTVHGYEGSGRGFLHKLQQFLGQTCPGWKCETLSQPIRWNPNDPLESALNHLLHLKPLSSNEVESPPRIECFSLDNLTFSAVSPQDWLDAPQHLEAVFQLLVQAHYQTRPNDLMQWLCTPNQQLWLAQCGQTPLAVLFGTHEGDFGNADLPDHVHGHLFAQQLRQVSAQDDWLRLRSFRIQRLTVAPAYQRQGIGHALLNAFLHAQATAFDFVSVSFGGTADLIHFWRQAGFVPLALSIKKDKASGHHSLAMAYPYSSQAKTLCATQNGSFHPQVAWQLTHDFQHLPFEMIQALLATDDDTPADFPMAYLESSPHQQPYEVASFSLRQWTLANLHRLPATPLYQRWVQKVLQNQDWSTLLTPEFAHRKALEKAFKTELKRLLADLK